MSKEDKDLVVVKKNIFSRILSALLNGLKGLFRVKPDNTEELAKAEKKIEKLENEIQSMENEERRLDKEAKREEKEAEEQENKELEEIEEIEEEQDKQKPPIIEDISLHLKDMEQDWTKEDSEQIGNKKVDFKEKIAPNGNKSSYYAINGIEVLSMIENEMFKHTKLVNYHFDTKIVDKFGVPMNEEVRNPAKDSYQEEYIDYENKRGYKKEVGPITDKDKNVIGNFKIIEETYKDGDVKFRQKTEQSIKDIENGQIHEIYEERVNKENASTYYKKIDGNMVYRETVDGKSQEITVELFDKEGNFYQSHKFDKKGDLIATFDAEGKKIFVPEINIVDGKEEIDEVPKPLPGIDKFPSYLNGEKTKEKDRDNYTKFIKDIGVDFKVPEDYFMEKPLKSSTIDIVNEARSQMKQKEKNRPRIEMKEPTKEDDPRE